MKHNLRISVSKEPRLFDALYDIDTISMSIFQPRRENVSTWTITVAELEEWAEQTLRPKAELALLFSFLSICLSLYRTMYQICSAQETLR